LLGWRQHGAAIRLAVSGPSPETLTALLTAGGLCAALAAAIPVDPPLEDQGQICLLSHCVERGSLSMMAMLLEQLRGLGGEELLTSARKARELAISHGASEVTISLTTHPVVELSFFGQSIALFCPNSHSIAVHVIIAPRIGQIRHVLSAGN